MTEVEMVHERSMFPRGFRERRDLEQYFWNQQTVHQLMKAVECEYEGTVCCMSTPSLAHAFYMCERSETLLDIDSRFAYLPKFRHFDIQHPTVADSEENRIVVFDPPFFYIPMEELFNAVKTICRGDFGTKLLIGFLVREEAALLTTFAPFNLKRTRFPLEYANVKPNKWRNYALKSNVDQRGNQRAPSRMK
jgi:hypothetical protein